MAASPQAVMQVLLLMMVDLMLMQLRAAPLERLTYLTHIHGLTVAVILTSIVNPILNHAL